MGCAQFRFIWCFLMIVHYCWIDVFSQFNILERTWYQFVSGKEKRFKILVKDSKKNFIHKGVLQWGSSIIYQFSLLCHQVTMFYFVINKFLFGTTLNYISILFLIELSPISFNIHEWCSFESITGWEWWFSNFIIPSLIRKSFPFIFI